MVKKRNPILDIDEKFNNAYIGYPTNKNTVGIDIDEDIVAHFDTKKKTLLGFTIFHWKSFKEKIYLKTKIKNSFKATNEYILKTYSSIPIPTQIILPQSSGNVFSTR